MAPSVILGLFVTINRMPLVGRNNVGVVKMAGIEVNGIEAAKMTSSPNNRVRSFNTASVVLGVQFGDEGKGKIVDLLCQNADIVCRCQVSGRYW